MKRHTVFLLTLLLSISAFLLCILVSVAPLQRLAGTTDLASLSLNMQLTVFGTWLPTDLHLANDLHASRINTDAIEFLAIMLPVFIVYSLSALLLWKGMSRPTDEQLPASSRASTGWQLYIWLLRYIWIGAILAGIIYVLTPSLLSRDAGVYAGYGRILVVYHANPYYTPLSAFAHDPLLPFDDWKNALAAYGPLWLAVCALSTLVAGSSVLKYIFFFRLLGFAAHLANIGLVTTILRKTKRSPRVIILGTFLYAWNPLALLESSLGGHNDIVMATLMLLGILLCVCAEEKDFSHARQYLAPAIVFTCAALVKFTAAPLLFFYIILLACRVLSSRTTSDTPRQKLYKIVREAGSTVLVSGILAGMSYIPLWFGHPLHAILVSLGSPPSSQLAFGSILLAIQNHVASTHEHNALLTIFSMHTTWNAINAVVVIAFSILGIAWLYRRPTTLTLVQAALALLIALLIVTPWFFPWYILWLLGLASISLPSTDERVRGALAIGALVFSASALLIYLFRGYPPIGKWTGFDCLTTIAPPLLAIGCYLLLFTSKRSRMRDYKQPHEVTNQLTP